MTARNGGLWKFVEVGVALVVPVLSAAIGWQANTLFNHESRISTLEAMVNTSIQELKEDVKEIKNDFKSHSFQHQDTP